MKYYYFFMLASYSNNCMELKSLQKIQEADVLTAISNTIQPEDWYRRLSWQQDRAHEKAKQAIDRYLYQIEEEINPSPSHLGGKRSNAQLVLDKNGMPSLGLLHLALSDARTRKEDELKKLTLGSKCAILFGTIGLLSCLWQTITLVVKSSTDDQDDRLWEKVPEYGGLVILSGLSIYAIRNGQSNPKKYKELTELSHLERKILLKELDMLNQHIERKK
jgi:hypothetical protein